MDMRHNGSMRLACGRKREREKKRESMCAQREGKKERERACAHKERERDFLSTLLDHFNLEMAPGGHPSQRLIAAGMCAQEGER